PLVSRFAPAQSRRKRARTSNLPEVRRLSRDALFLVDEIDDLPQVPDDRLERRYRLCREFLRLWQVFAVLQRIVLEPRGVELVLPLLQLLGTELPEAPFLTQVF